MRQQIAEVNGEESEKQAKRQFEICLEQFLKGESCSHIAWQLRRSAAGSFYSHLAQALEVCQRRTLSNDKRNYQIYLNLNLAASSLDPEDSEQQLIYRRTYDLADNEIDIFS
ncbi:hypothetical protein HGA34_05520 [Candidatus Falkowbacteria bacterium]|nr:hypothetical protein [Candidatus Falkowbacteria bacterium]